MLFYHTQLEQALFPLTQAQNVGSWLLTVVFAVRRNFLDDMKRLNIEAHCHLCLGSKRAFTLFNIEKIINNAK